ncbi:MAG: hypothetical protein GY879_06110 [Planctomycetes bacterium]|nr:hypothetical protein [Planctomycetota bacterium]MCP4861684.1 hypothetical protein [Planctomycetota bacterium]
MNFTPALLLAIVTSAPLLAQNPTPAAPLAAAGAEVTTAVLSDGTRLDVKPGTEVGTFMVQTEFGILCSQGQQVNLIVDGKQEVRILEPLRELDYAQWVARLVERGHINRLFADVPPTEQKGVLLEALRIWGLRLDALSPKIDRDERVEALHKQLLKTTNPNQIALLVGALEREISPLPNSKRRLTVAEWGQVLESPIAARRWAATRLAAVLNDANLELDLLKLSLQDKKLWVALEAGRALDLIDEKGAIYRWSYEMVRTNPTKVKNRGALQLAAWSRLRPKNAEEMTSRVRSGAFFRTNPYPPVYRPLNDRDRRYSDDGHEGTFHSVLVVGVPSRVLMLQVADVIERVGNASKMEPPAAEPLSEGASTADFEKAQGEAWRKVFLGR